jgi:hypothetical protein
MKRLQAESRRDLHPPLDALLPAKLDRALSIRPSALINPTTAGLLVIELKKPGSPPEINQVEIHLARVRVSGRRS